MSHHFIQDYAKVAHPAASLYHLRAFRALLLDHATEGKWLEQKIAKVAKGNARRARCSIQPLYLRLFCQTVAKLGGDVIDYVRTKTLRHVVA